MRYILLVFGPLVFLAGVIAAEEDTWLGGIEIMGNELTVLVKFFDIDGVTGATIDIPQQGAFKLPLINVQYEEEKVYFELHAGPGIAVFDGVREGERITGRFSQAGMVGTFQLNRVNNEKPVDKDPLPYREEFVYVSNDEIRLGCTLTLPELESGSLEEAYPALILITGSGPQDRDESIFGFKPFLLIAEHLILNGISVLRCDDRGVGESTGNIWEAALSDFAQDVKSKLKYLRDRDDIDREKIGLLGHSEGGIIAAMVAAKEEDISFVISLAGPAILGKDLLILQSELIFRAMGVDESILEQQIELIHLIYEAGETDEGWDEIERKVREVVPAQFEQMTAEQRESIEDLSQYLENSISTALYTIKSPWYRSFIRHDPSKDLMRVKQPILGLFGELDLQVPPELNKIAMREALEYAGNGDYTLKILPGANHLFQKAETGSPEEYPLLDKEFIDGFLGILSGWIIDRIGNE